MATEETFEESTAPTAEEIAATETAFAKRLHALCSAGGVLRIITNEHACGGGVHPSKEPFDAAVCEAFEFDKKKPRHFVVHDVVKIEGPDAKGRYHAYSDPEHGDWTYGMPSALLKRLQEANQAGVP